MVAGSSQWIAAGGGAWTCGQVQLWSCGTSFTSCPPSWQQGRVSNSSLRQNRLLLGPGFHPAFPDIPRKLQLWPQSSFCAAWWEEVTHSRERGVLSRSCNAGYFCTIAANMQPLHFLLRRKWRSNLLKLKFWPRTRMCSQNIRGLFKVIQLNVFVNTKSCYLQNCSKQHVLMCACKLPSPASFNVCMSYIFMCLHAL